MEFGNQTKSYESRLLRNALNSFKACGYEQIDISSSVSTLNVPDEAKYALLKLVSDGTGDVANYLEFRLPVTSTDGIPISNGTVFDITDYSNLIGFNITEITANNTTLHVQYYK